MNTWFYYDSEDDRQGPINDNELKELARQGRILPDTVLETPNGNRGYAKQLPGIFPQQGSSTGGQSVPRQASPAGGSNRFCTNCGKPVSPQAVACMSCGASPVGHRKFCNACGTTLNPEQIICIKCGAGINAAQNGYNNAGNYGQPGYRNQPGMYPGNPGMNGGYAPYRPVSPPKNRKLAGWLGILFGHFGVHKFYMGSWGWGLVYLGVVFLTCFFAVIVTGILGMVEGITYLMMSDEDFEEKYPNETISPFRW